MALTPVYSALARADLSDIWDHTVAYWGISQAEKYIRDIEKQIDKLAMFPFLGQACDELRVGYHRILIGRHIAFYQKTSTGIRVRTRSFRVFA